MGEVGKEKEKSRKKKGEQQATLSFRKAGGVHGPAPLLGRVHGRVQGRVQGRVPGCSRRRFRGRFSASAAPRSSRLHRFGKAVAMGVEGCTKCIKYLLFVFNFIFWVSTGAAGSGA